MLLKFSSRCSNKMHIIDNIERPEFSKDPIYLYSAQELQELLQGEIYTDLRMAVAPSLMAPSEAPVDPFLESAHTVNLLVYERLHDDGWHRHAVLFDGESYLCNDEGKTVHLFKPCAMHPKNNLCQGVGSSETPKPAAA